MGLFEFLSYVILYSFCDEVDIVLSNYVFKKILMSLGLLRYPSVCIIGHLGGLVSCGVVAEGVSCVIVSPTPWSPCVGAMLLALSYVST